MSPSRNSFHHYFFMFILEQGDAGPQGPPGVPGLGAAPGEAGEKGRKGEKGQEGLLASTAAGLQGCSWVRGDEEEHLAQQTLGLGAVKNAK